MGSSGSGSFSDYSGTQGSAGGRGGGTSGEDRCERAFSCRLEEVEQCDYFVNNQELPDPQTPLSVVLDGRLFAVDEDGTKVGALPTAYNYLAGCMKQGHQYVGLVAAAGTTPHPFVSVDISPKGSS